MSSSSKNANAKASAVSKPSNTLHSFLVARSSISSSSRGGGRGGGSGSLSRGIRHGDSSSNGGGSGDSSSKGISKSSSASGSTKGKGTKTKKMTQNKKSTKANPPKSSARDEHFPKKFESLINTKKLLNLVALIDPTRLTKGDIQSYSASSSSLEVTSGRITKLLGDDGKKMGDKKGKFIYTR